MACKTATELVFFSAIGTWRKGQGKRDHVNVFIPGDFAYIINKAQRRNRDQWVRGLEGENLIHVGINADKKELFWGHFDPNKSVRTKKEWENYVKDEFRGKQGQFPDVSFSPNVFYPLNGLDNKR